MHINTPSGTLRYYTSTDAPALVIHANNPDIAQWMRDGFPSPYTREDADRFIAMATSDHPGIFLAIEVDGMPVGGIGIHPLEDVYRRTAEIGYWISPSFQGKGIVSDAVRALVSFVFEKTDIIRIQAGVFQGNLPSIRVLEKNGFSHEATHKHAIFKNGQLLDECLYVIFRTDGRKEKHLSS